MNWQKINIPIKPQILEQIAPLLFNLGASGLEEQNDSFSVYFPQSIWSGDKLDALRRLLNPLVTDADKIDISVEAIPDQNWNESWKENFKTLRVSERIIIHPEWETYQPQKDELAIIISPKMAFGTGHHETTRMVLLLMEKYFRPGLRFLDAGTGSGILALLAAKMGASAIVAFDNDPVAMDNCRENFALNQIDMPAQLFTGTPDQIHNQQFDMITANIERNVLMEMASDLHRLIVPGGLAVLSGLLDRDAGMVAALYKEKGWILIEEMQDKEWMALVLRYE